MSAFLRSQPARSQSGDAGCVSCFLSSSTASLLLLCCWPLHSHHPRTPRIYTLYTGQRRRCAAGGDSDPPIAETRKERRAATGSEEHRLISITWPHRRPGTTSTHKAKASASSPPAPCSPVPVPMCLNVGPTPGLCMRTNARAAVPTAYGCPTRPCFCANPARSLPIVPAIAYNKTPRNTRPNALPSSIVSGYQPRLCS